MFNMSDQNIILKLTILVVSLTCLRGVKSQVKYFGGCPSVSVQKNFDAIKYTGIWYESEKYPFVFEFGGKCVTANYTMLSNNTIRVLNRQLSIYTGKIQEIFGQGMVVGNAKLSVELGPRPFSSRSPYWVLSTDYDKYAVVYTCIQLGFFHTRVVWILTRERNPPDEIITAARDIISDKGLSVESLIKTDQNSCEHFDRTEPISITLGFIKDK